MKSIKKLSLITTLFALVLTVSFSSAQAQVTAEADVFVLKGQVVDATAGTPLADAEIIIAGQDISTVSDAEGNFILENLPAGEHTVKVKLDGYQTWEKKMALDQDAELTVKLVPEKKAE